MARRLLTFKNDGDVLPTAPAGVTLYVLRDGGSACDDLQWWISHTYDEQVALIKSVAPSSPTGWTPDACNDSDDWKIYDPGDGSGGFIAIDGTTTPTTPTTPTSTPTVNNNDDQAGWENLGINKTNQTI